jgi:putative membrane protein
MQPDGQHRNYTTLTDVTLDSITTTIEADMCDTLGREGPPPVQPVDGVLW